MSYGNAEPHPRPPALPHPALPHPALPPLPALDSGSHDGRPDGGAPPRSRAGDHGALRRLRRTYRRQRRVTTVLALGYFTAFLVLSANEPDLMARPLPGGLPLGVVLALSHVPVTWLAVLLYELTARRYVDPLARRIERHASWGSAPGRGPGR
ncbi:DUF485 domain-containing protein [Streptomyces sp. NPDC003247]|uniref:DUF485 domain-containing protein n=1 Tax=Streptomyces sp. NPDC003247 TaxID=3364677 RepID=UPI0036A272F7